MYTCGASILRTLIHRELIWGWLMSWAHLIRLNKAAPTPCPQPLYWETSGNEQSTGNSIIIYYIRYLTLSRWYLAWWSTALVLVARTFNKKQSLGKAAGLQIRAATMNKRYATINEMYLLSYHDHDDVMKWKHFPRYWPFVRGIHRSPVNFPHKGQWRGALMFSLILLWINDWVNTREAGDWRRYLAHYDVTVMIHLDTL